LVGANRNLSSAGVRPVAPETGEACPEAPRRVQADDPVLRYTNGSEVTDNDKEIQAFRAYVTAERKLPNDIDALRQWVRDTPKWPRMPPNPTEN
jgi:hypothetical protein